MKLVILFSTLVFSSSLFAAEGNFDEHKKNFVNHLNEHAVISQKANDCAKAAQNDKTLKACKDAFHKELKSLKEKHKAAHVKKIDEKIKKLQEEKKGK
jgi:hypothetical protein